MSENSSIMDSMFGAFGQKVEDVKVKEEQTGSKLKLFKPDPNSTANKQWTGIVKFLPNLSNLETPMVKKTTYWLTDPTNNKGFLYESPKSLGKYEDCVVASKYWEWKESGDARLVEQSKKLSYSRKCFVLVQVIRDMQDDSNNGNIYLWNVPHNIQKMIDETMYPSQDDIDLGNEPHNPFDPFNGRTMTLKIGVNEHGRDWSSCTWSKETVPTTMILAGEKAPVKLSADATELKKQQQAALQTIIDSEVTLEDVVYKPADESTLARVQKVLAIMAGEPVNTDSAASESEDQTTDASKQLNVTTASGVVSQPSTTTSENSEPTGTSTPNVDDDFMNEVMNEK